VLDHALGIAFALEPAAAFTVYHLRLTRALESPAYFSITSSTLPSRAGRKGPTQ
jgi:hypothetical protein